MGRSLVRGHIPVQIRPFYFIPMKSLEEIIGVLGILCDSKDLFPEQRRLLGTISNLTTIVAARWMSLKFKRD